MYKIRSARSPLIMGRREKAKIGGIEWDWERIWVIWIFGGTSEKGSTRKHTEKRVTSWSKMFWRNLSILRWFTKRMFLGEFKFDDFWGFTRESTWCYWGGGALVLLLCVLEEPFGWFNCVPSAWEWGDLRPITCTCRASYNSIKRVTYGSKMSVRAIARSLGAYHKGGSTALL
jgi:hypothetical protein